MKNLRKQKNTAFIKQICSICLDIFDADADYVYETTFRNGKREVYRLVCYDCAKETEDKIIKRINEKISYLEEVKEALSK